MLIIKLLLFSACVLPTVVSFTVPKPKIEAIYPKGFRVSSPSKFYVKLNVKLNNLQNSLCYNSGFHCRNIITKTYDNSLLMLKKYPKRI